MKRRIIISVASVALFIGGLAVAQAGAATKTVSASGGSVRFTAAVRNASTCRWSSNPSIPSFTKTVKCKSGIVAKSARIAANTSTTAKSYEVTLTVRGKSTTVDRWKVTQAGASTTTTTTTTTTKDPPTAIAIVASESPAIVGDVITYSMTVAGVLTATQGAVYMTDNGVTLTNCSGPAATNQGSLTYSCDVAYTDVGSHLIVGVFLGNTIYGQSAGQLVETVQLTSSSTTTTTTTTAPPAPLATVTMNVYYAGGVVATPRPVSVVTESNGQDPYTGDYLSFQIFVYGNYAQPIGDETLYVNGAIPVSCAIDDSGACLEPESGYNTDPTTDDGQPIEDGYIFLEFVTPGTYTVTDTYSGDNTYPSAQAQAIVVNAS